MLVLRITELSEATQNTIMMVCGIFDNVFVYILENTSECIWRLSRRKSLIYITTKLRYRIITLSFVFIISIGH